MPETIMFAFVILIMPMLALLFLFVIANEIDPETVGKVLLCGLFVWVGAGLWLKCASTYHNDAVVQETVPIKTYDSPQGGKCDTAAYMQEGRFIVLNANDKFGLDFQEGDLVNLKRYPEGYHFGIKFMESVEVVSVSPQAKPAEVIAEAPVE